MNIGKKIFCIAVFAFAAAMTMPSYAEINKQSAEILDKASSLYRDKGDLEIDMNIVFKDGQTKSEKSAKGNLKTKGKKFVLETEFATMMFDGKYMYVYSDDADELTITEPEPDEISVMDPTALLDIYKSKFKITEPEKLNKNGKQIYSINLFPENLNVDYIKLNITIDQKDFSICSVSTHAKNGMVNTIEINKIKTEQKFDDSIFVFNQSRFPNATVIDLR